MFALIDTIADMFFSPLSGVRKAAGLSWKKIILFFSAMTVLVSFPELRELFPYAGNASLMGIIAFQIILFFSFLCTLSFAINGLMGLFYDKASDIKSLLSGFIFSYTPFLLIPFFALLPGSSYSKEALVAVFSLWNAYLLLVAIKNAYEISVFSAFAIILLSICLFVMLNVIFLIYIGMYIGLGVY